MALDLKCELCGEDISKPGALLFSPPHVLLGGRMVCEKRHICDGCYGFLDLCIDLQRAYYASKQKESQ